MIQRACDDVYSSRASSAFASASTVERNVRSSPSKLEALAIASLAWCASPPSRSSSRVAVLDLGAGRDGDRPPASLENERRDDGRRVGEHERLQSVVERPRDPLSENRTAGSDRSADDDVAARRVLEPEGGVRRRDQLCSPLDDAFEHALEPLRRGEVAPELEQRLRALGLAALRLVEACVLERDGGMAGEHLEEAQVVLVELLRPSFETTIAPVTREP